ncbi:hypothetical protein M3B39_006770 [Micrococcus luteus]|nr:hypothetical protein [Micrococcus luteus]
MARGGEHADAPVHREHVLAARRRPGLRGPRLARAPAAPGGPPARAGAPAALDDDAWARRLAGVLRLRKDLPDARVAEIVRDARARGAAAGRPLAEELGSPEAYAAGFRKDRVAAPRRRAWAVTALVVLILATRLPGVVAGERLSAWDVAYLLVAVVVLVWEWRDYRAAVRRARG